MTRFLLSLTICVLSASVLFGATLPVTDGLQLWLDPSDASTVSTCDVSHAHEWADKSPNEYTFEIGSSFPMFDEDAFAPQTGPALSGVAFDGVDDWMESPTTDVLNFATDSVTVFLFADVDKESADKGACYFFTNIQSEPLGYRFTSHPDGLRYQANGDAGSVSVIHECDFAGPKAYGFVHDRELGTVSIYAGGAQLGLTEYVAAVGDTSSSDAVFAIGANPLNMDQRASGAFGEFLLYNRALSAAEIQSVNDYLEAKWIIGEAQGTLEGDLNADGFVGSADLDIVRANWGAETAAGDLSAGDPSGDGMVGSADLDIVRANWGAQAPAAVPEPSAFLLLPSLLGLFLLRGKRVRIVSVVVAVVLVGVVSGPAAHAVDLSVTDGLQLWLDPSNEDGVATCSWGSFYQLNDLSGNGNDMQLIYNPELVADAIPTTAGGTMPAVNLDGHWEYMRLSDPSQLDYANSSMTAFVVTDCTSGYFFSKKGPSNQGYRLTTSGDDLRWQSGPITVKRACDFANTTVYAAVHDRELDMVKLFGDGIQLGLEEYVADAGDTTQDDIHFSIAANPDPRSTHRAAGNFSEILFYDRALSDAEIQAVNDYLVAKWVTGSTAAVPEPQTLLLLVLGALWGCLRRR